MRGTRVRAPERMPEAASSTADGPPGKREARDRNGGAADELTPGDSGSVRFFVVHLGILKSVMR